MLESNKNNQTNLGIQLVIKQQASLIPAHVHTLCAGNLNMLTGNKVRKYRSIGVAFGNGDSLQEIHHPRRNKQIPNYWCRIWQMRFPAGNT